MEHAEKIFVEIAKQYETCEEMTEALRSLNSAGELSTEEYDYLNEEWDNLLAEYGF